MGLIEERVNEILSVHTKYKSNQIDIENNEIENITDLFGGKEKKKEETKLLKPDMPDIENNEMDDEMIEDE